jgi:uncharacterized protein
VGKRNYSKHEKPMKKIMEDLKREVQKRFKKSKGSHDWEHTERVFTLCKRIGKKEKADMTVLAIAAILHDIGRTAEDHSKGKIDHATLGVRMARKILSSYPLSDQMIEAVVHCIATHRFRGYQIPQSKEAKILYDADKLDAIGAVGIGRAFLFAGEQGANLHDRHIVVGKTKQYTKQDTAYREFLVKLRFIKDKIFTSEGKKIARERHRYMIDFFDRLNQEVDAQL